ncbi:MAG: tRNA preQ1(34) S-adenosylmethionine ribosyltransferase-isomerase QueA [Cyanobacteria bacterium P01_F01_bin.33]
MPAPSIALAPADLEVTSYDYALPVEAIAQTPVVPRDRSRLLVVNGNTHHHSHFYQLSDWLKPHDILVLNDTKVIPARLFGEKSTGAKVEVLLLERQQPEVWLALVKPGRRIRPGATLTFGPDLLAEVTDTDPATGGRYLRFTWPESHTFEDLLRDRGQIPFPPYVTTRQARDDQYQTVWASQSGAVAAPTAGLHFTPELLQHLRDRGIYTATITLHVGLGTFRPVEVERVNEHHLHSEWLDVPVAAVEAIARARQAGGRVIAVGTTVARSLETAAQSGELQPWQGKSDLFIYPGYQWRVLDGLITNFHLPKSSLLMLVSALMGRSYLLDLYAEALQVGYRFYSFGDGMAILPEPPVSLRDPS